MSTSYANLVNDCEYYGDKGPIMITRDVADLPGGVTLDVSAWPNDVIPAGTIIVKGTNGLKPAAISGNAYTGSTGCIGILKHTILRKDPRAAVMTMGQANFALMPFGGPTAEMREELTQINFIHVPDEEGD